MSDRFTEKAENALNKSVKTAEKLGHTYIGSEHLLLALADDELCCASLILKKNGINKEIDEAILVAEKDPYPEPEDCIRGVYSEDSEE